MHFTAARPYSTKFAVMARIARPVESPGAMCAEKQKGPRTPRFHGPVLGILPAKDHANINDRIVPGAGSRFTQLDVAVLTMAQVGAQAMKDLRVAAESDSAHPCR